MTSKACWYCGGLPKLWWWLATLIGLPLIFFFMISDRQGPVEADLTERVRTELINKEVYWAEVNLDERGRDVMLSGKAPDEASREAAIETAQSVNGVRIVEHDIEILPLKSPELSVQTHNGKVTLKGLLPSQGLIDSTIAAAGETFGADNVNNQLGVGERLKESDWLSKIAGFLPALSSWKTASFDINDDGSKISGIARTDEAKGELLQQAKSLIGGKLEDGITIKPLQAATFAAAMAGGKLTLDGLLPTQESADSLVNAATKRIGADNLVNQLTVSEDAAEAPWLGQAQKLLGSFTDADTTANIADGKLTVAGTVNSFHAHINAVGAANAAIAGSDLQLQDDIKLDIPAQPEAEFAIFQKAPPTKAAAMVADFDDGKITLKGTIGSQQEADALVDAANQKVGAENVSNQLTINDEHMPASWLEQAKKLITSFTHDSNITIHKEQATLSGTVDGYQKHLTALGVAQAAVRGSDLLLRDNITIDIPAQPEAKFATFIPATSGELTANLTDGKLTLSGTLAAQQEVDTAVDAANTRVGADNVINQLAVDKQRRPADWLENAKNLLLNLPGIKGAMSINDDQAVFSGTTETNEDYLTAIRKARGAMQGQQMAFENNVTLDTSRIEQERLAKEKAEREEQERLA
ncbi:MAG: BON domain-containing protein, partial [Thiolinea sp.]